jgi:hypothetical protein
MMEAGPAAQPREEQSSEEERQVLAWRYQQIRALGFERLEARLLAKSDAELALVRRLIKAGCPTAVALKITL